MTGAGAASAVHALGPALDVPVQPDRDTARGWLVEELSRAEYAQSPSLLERLLGWLLSLFDGELPGLDVPPWQLLLGAVVATAVVVAVAWWVAGPVRLARRARRPSAVVLDDDARTAAQLRAAADDAAARGAWAVAVAERFRAVVRGLEERVVIDERPGRTAQEAAAAGAERLPDLAGPLHRAATLFDDVHYGDLPAGPADDALMRDLDARVQAARPASAGPAAVPGTGR